MEIELQVAELSNKVVVMDKMVNGININVSTILQLLRGNELDKDDNGFVGEVSELTKRVTVMEKQRDRFVWVIIGMGIPASIGVVNILNDIVRAFNK